jgi:acetolactate decarboxylase
MKSAFFPALLAVPVLTLFVGAAALTPPSWQPAVQVYGAMRNFMKGNDFGGKVQLSTLTRPHLYGLGVASGLRGELLAWDGTITLTTVAPGGKTTSRPAPAASQAALLVTSEVAHWQAVPLPTAVADVATLERLITRAAAQRGLDTTTALPFRLSGRPIAVHYHVMDWPGSTTQHTMENHKQYAVKGTFVNEAVEVLGFFSRQHQSIFTHHSTFLHMHARPAGRAFAGHVDDLRFAPGAATLYLPAPR